MRLRGHDPLSCRGCAIVAIVLIRAHSTGAGLYARI
jgi:hypothetical protein